MKEGELFSDMNTVVIQGDDFLFLLYKCEFPGQMVCSYGEMLNSFVKRKASLTVPHSAFPLCPTR